MDKYVHKLFFRHNKSDVFGRLRSIVIICIFFVWPCIDVRQRSAKRKKKMWVLTTNIPFLDSCFISLPVCTYEFCIRKSSLVWAGESVRLKTAVCVHKLKKYIYIFLEKACTFGNGTATENNGTTHIISRCQQMLTEKGENRWSKNSMITEKLYVETQKCSIEEVEIFGWTTKRKTPIMLKTWKLKLWQRKTNYQTTDFYY